MYGIPLIGLDSYRNGKGRLLITAASMIPMVDSRGVEMDANAMVTLFNDMCFMAPATLIDPRLQWETVDSLTAKGTLTLQGRKISAWLYFNPQGQLINFVSDDRYYQPVGESPRRARWSTPIREYRETGGIKLGTSGEAIWHLNKGDLRYAKFRLREITYNCERIE